MMLSCLFVVFFAVLSFALPNEQHVLVSHEHTASTIRDVLLANSIIPDVLDDFEPLYYIDVEFAKHHDRVLLGNNITVKHVSKRPHFTIHKMEDPAPTIPRLEKTYTLILTDPDAKSRDNPKWSEMCHWIVTNLTAPITESSLQFATEKKAGELVEYKPPGPPPKTGPHRYVFVLLEGDTSDIRGPEDRKHWGYGKPRHGVRDWAAENGLVVVGANFFFAANKKQ